MNRREEIFEDHSYKLACKTDRMFAGLFGFQWLFGFVLSLWVSPQIWAGTEGEMYKQVYIAIFFGAALAIPPLYLTLFRNGHGANRFVVAFCQIGFSILFIHLTDGRYETHFHVFGSIAFIACYQDPRPLLLATLIAALDYFVRGTMEHTLWILFEDIFLIISMKITTNAFWAVADKQLELEETLGNVELIVENRTNELLASNRLILDQEQALVQSSKMSALGEMASGIAHEINTPLLIIQLRAERLEDMARLNLVQPQAVLEIALALKTIVSRISKIINGMKTFARDGKMDPFQKTDIKAIIQETFGFCLEKFKNNEIELEFVTTPADLGEVEIECRPVEISQVLLNLINNAFDAVAGLSKKWVHVELISHAENIELRVTDSGSGIPEKVRDKLMQPFFTTKAVGQGTGLGLSISRGIILAHKGWIYLDADSPNTRFVIVLPKRNRCEKDAGMTA